MAERPTFDPTRVRVPPVERADTGELLSPIQVNNLVSGAITRHLPATLHVVAEIGDLSRPSSGHIYFTLKDAQAELRAVMWRSAAAKLKFTPEPGMQVVATGGLEVYAARGTYQLIVRRIEPRGVGALEIAFRQLREKLEREGLFDARRKKPLPRIPERIAVVTSPNGAALRDILRTIARRFAGVEVFVFPTRVQGEGSAAEIATAIGLMNSSAEQLGGIDVAIVGRGGGSTEDLWCFNEEVVARAIAASRVPIVSAVGHEVDVTISDFVADVRAATPTAAAELVTPDSRELAVAIQRASHRATRSATNTLDVARHALARVVAYDGIARPMSRVNERAQRLDELAHRLALAIGARFGDVRTRLSRAELVMLRFAAGAQFARLSQRLDNRSARLLAGMTRTITRAQQRLLRTSARTEHALPLGRIGRSEEHLRQADSRMRLAAARAIATARARLDASLRAAQACDPKRTLQRGYSITRDARTREVLRSTRVLKPGTRVITELADGEFRSTADDQKQPRLFE
ncbi:MAG: exodeoxyribonuclease VII large subunit [Phycisphaerae bacterium]